MKKKILSLVLALGALSTMAYAGPKSLAVDCGDQAQISATPLTGYHFVKWSDGSTETTRTFTPDKDSTLKAFFAINRYSILFKNYNGDTLQVDSVDHGTAVAYNGGTPTKPATAQYTYIFIGWTPNIVTPAVDNATYVAEFDVTVNQYTIAFLNWDSTVLQSSEWDYGATPVYSGSTPTKPSTAKYDYTFKGWDKTIASVTGEAKYVAQYDSTIISYQISVTPNNANYGSTTGSGTYQYGQKATITATAKDCYPFVKWDDGDTNATREVEVTGVKTYTAIFEKIQYTVTVESDNESQGTVDVKKL